MTPTEQSLPVASRRACWAYIWNQLMRRRPAAIGSILGILGASSISIATPAILGLTVDAIVESDLPRILCLIGLLVLTVLFRSAVVGAVTACLARLAEEVMAELREDVVQTALALPVQRLEAAGTGDLVARLSHDINAIVSAVRAGFLNLTVGTVSAGVTLLGLGAIDRRFLLVLLIIVPCHLMSARWYLKRSRSVHTQERTAVSEREQSVVETLAGLRTVRGLGLGAKRLDLVDRLSSVAVTRSMRAADVRERFALMIQGGEFAGLAVGLAIALTAFDEGAITVGAATSALLYLMQLFDPVGDLLRMLDTAEAASAALTRLVGIVELKSTDRPELLSEPAEAPTVTLRRVSFQYDDETRALEDVDLRIHSGELIALVGPSGSGKSTLARLIAGQLAPTVGGVEVNGMRLDSDWIRGGLGRVVCVVTQEPYLFAGSIADNLRLAAPSATDQMLLAALSKVGAGPWLESLPEALHTIVNPNEETEVPALRSQQVALARALLTEASLLVLDEATGNLGETAAAEFDEAIERIRHGRTIVLIAHHLGQASSADRIVVLESGQLVEAGSHAQLVQQRGLYSKLWRAWRPLVGPAITA